MKKIWLLSFSIHCLVIFTGSAQQPKAVAAKSNQTIRTDSLTIPISKAELGTFPYFKTLHNFYANDSVTYDQNRAYFFDGKKYFAVDGKTSRQNLTIRNSNEKAVSTFGCIQEFDKVIAILGGVKIYTGKLPDDKLKAYTGSDVVELGSKGQLTPSAYYGVVEYVIKTAEKEVWVQLQPYSLDSKFYTLLVTEKQIPLISLNTTRRNQLLTDLERTRKATIQLSFEPDDATLLPESKDEILSMLGIFQSHPDWKVALGCYNAPVGNPAYCLSLTEKRANAIKQELMRLGIKSDAIDAKGFGDQKPLVANDTEQGRLTNTRIEIMR